MPELYVDAITPKVKTLGPGLRIGLWVQGCTLGCPGCISPELHHRNPKGALPAESIYDRLVQLAPSHDGLTVSGGEPFEQVEALGELLARIRAKTSLDILVYSGFRLEEIEQIGSDALRMLSFIDVLIDGRYRRDLPTNLIWRGSSNQRMHLLTQRGQQHQHFVGTEYPDKRPLQVDWITDKRLRIIGIPEPGKSYTVSQKTELHGCHLIRRAD